MNAVTFASLLVLGVSLAGCPSPSAAPDASITPHDAATHDAATRDVGPHDAYAVDVGRFIPPDDADLPSIDATDPSDAGARDCRPTAGNPVGLGCTAPVTTMGGPVLAHPSFVTITYDDDQNRAGVEAFADLMAASTDWWARTTAEYGVGPLVSLGSVRLAEHSPTHGTETDIRNRLLALAADGTLPRDAAGSFDDVIYLVYLPGGADVTLDDGGQACGSWHGYHAEVRDADPHLVYALAIECGPNRGFDHLGYLEAAASHELIEAATDPHPFTDPAWIDPMAELTDRCVGLYDVIGRSVLARSWSNAAATSGRAPCQPAPDDEPFAGIWLQDDPLRGAPGTDATTMLFGFASQPIADFTVTLSGDYPADLGRSSLNEGISTPLTVHIPSTARAGDVGYVQLVFTAAPQAPMRVTLEVDVE